MNTDATKPFVGLEKGQLWEVDGGYLEIVDIGGRHVHYKMKRRPDHKSAITRLISLDALAVYLKEAKLQTAGHMLSA